MQQGERGQVEEAVEVEEEVAMLMASLERKKKNRRVRNRVTKNH